MSDHVGKYIPDAPPAWGDITIRHLLTHTSGLRREAPAADLNTSQPDIELIRSAYSLPLQWKPGDKYDYSNLGYYTLAEVITRVNGTPWPEFMQRRVFGPLGMTRTTTTGGGTFPYGDGWELDDFPPGQGATGVPMIRHEGTIPGFRPGFTRLPKQGLTVILLANLDRGQGRPVDRRDRGALRAGAASGRSATVDGLGGAGPEVNRPKT